MVYTEYLDMYDLLVNQVSGGVGIFIFVSIVVIFLMGARLRFPDIISFGILIIFLLLISPFITDVLVLVILAIAIFITWGLLRIISGNK